MPPKAVLDVLPSGYVTLERAAELDGVTRAAIYDRITRGVLPYIKHGRRLYVHHRSLKKNLVPKNDRTVVFPKEKARTCMQISIPVHMMKCLAKYADTYGKTRSEVIQEAVHLLLSARWSEYSFGLSENHSQKNDG